jgi:hypothetical protein
MIQSKKSTFIVAAIFALQIVMNPISAAQEPLRSLMEMESRSELIADGKVTDIRLIETEKIPHPYGSPVVREKYRASFQVEKLIKGSLGNQGATGLVYLEYWQTDDKRFRGGSPPKISLGDEFRLFGETVNLRPDGGTTVNIHTTSAVRPEAFDSPSSTQSPKSLSDTGATPTQRSNTALLELGRTSVPEAVIPVQQTKYSTQVTPSAKAATEPKSAPWPWVLGLLLLAVFGGVWWKFLRK